MEAAAHLFNLSDDDEKLTFFCAHNVGAIQDAIVRCVNRLSGGAITVDRQDDYSLSPYMYRVFETGMHHDSIQVMNRKVVSMVAEEVLVGVQLRQHYVHSKTHLPEPMERPRFSFKP